MSERKATDRETAAVAADLLAHGAAAHRLSTALTLAAALAVPVMGVLHPNAWGMALATLAALLGLAELWLALRIAFDARIFSRLAQGDAAEGLEVGGFDAAMRTIGLLQAEKIGRPVALRVRGAMALLGRQVAVLAAQVVTLAASGWVLVATGS